MKTQNYNYAPPLEEGLFRNRHDPIPRGTKLLGKYTVERQLGAGGMGIVVSARHDVLDELVALKFLLPKAMTNRQAVGRFLREARASARLRSEHVVRVHDVGELDTGEPYMVMEYLEGDDLKSILRKRGQLPILEAAEYFLQACKGVAAAHAKNIVHRDLKPANLFLTKTADDEPLVKVFDFGIARIVDPNEADMTHDDILGSIPYMSPEQLSKPRTVDWRTDLWSMGVVLCELLTTKRPFDGEGANDCIFNIVNGNPVPVSVWRADVPPALQEVINQCLCKDRNGRYQSAHELALAVSDALSLPPPVRPPMASISISDPQFLPDELLTPEPPTKQEPSGMPPVAPDQTQRTQGGVTVTGQPPSSLRTNRLKLAGAAAASMATSAAVVMLVVALRGAGAELAPVNASAGPAMSTSGNGVPVVLPEPSASAAPTSATPMVEMEEAEKAALVAMETRTEKTISVGEIKKKGSAGKTDSPPAAPVPPTSAPPDRRPPVPKPSSEPVTSPGEIDGPL